MDLLLDCEPSLKGQNGNFLESIHQYFQALKGGNTFGMHILGTSFPKIGCSIMFFPFLLSQEQNMSPAQPSLALAHPLVRPCPSSADTHKLFPSSGQRNRSARTALSIIFCTAAHNSATQHISWGISHTHNQKSPETLTLLQWHKNTTQTRWWHFKSVSQFYLLGWLVFWRLFFLLLDGCFFFLSNKNLTL